MRSSGALCNFAETVHYSVFNVTDLRYLHVEVFSQVCFIRMLTCFWLVLTKTISFSSPLSLFQSWFLWQDLCSNQQVEFFLYNLKWEKKNRETTCNRIILTVLQPAHRPALTALLTWYETSTGNVTAARHVLWNSGLFSRRQREDPVWAKIERGGKRTDGQRERKGKGTAASTGLLRPLNQQSATKGCESGHLLLLCQDALCNKWLRTATVQQTQVQPTKTSPMRSNSFQQQPMMTVTTQNQSHWPVSIPPTTSNKQETMPNISWVKLALQAESLNTNFNDVHYLPTRHER